MEIRATINYSQRDMLPHNKAIIVSRRAVLCKKKEEEEDIIAQQGQTQPRLDLRDGELSMSSCNGNVTRVCCSFSLLLPPLHTPFFAMNDMSAN